MTDDAEIPPPPSLAPDKKTRGRPAKVTPETPQQRIERLQAELQQAHEAKKRAERHRDSIVGAAVVTHALAHADFRRQIADILRAEVKGKADLAAIAELLVEPGA